MKKNLLILLFFPMIFNSCQNENRKYVGLWEFEGESYWYFSEDGSACNDVHYGHHGVSIINDLENCSCDDRKNLGSWMKVNNQNFLLLTFKGESHNVRILNETPDLLELDVMGRTLKLKRISESAFKRRLSPKRYSLL